MLSGVPAAQMDGAAWGTTQAANFVSAQPTGAPSAYATQTEAQPAGGFDQSQSVQVNQVLGN